MFSQILFILLVVLSLFYPLMSGAKTIKAHAHGESNWSLAFEGQTGRLMIDTPAESLLGFEKEPKKKKEIEKANEALAQFEKSISQMVVIPEMYGCQWSKKALDIIRAEPESKHCEIEGEFEITCQKNLDEAKITFNIQKYFPRFRLVNFEILFGNIQKSLPVTKSGTKVYLK